MDKRTIGIITIHKIHNLGSVLQTYALWRILREQGHSVEIIDYKFPNEFHLAASDDEFHETQGFPKVTVKEKAIKAIYARALMKQHRLTDSFLNRMDVSFSKESYSSREQLLRFPPKYDVYISGSDQIWNPRYTCGDDIFLLSFAPDSSRKISYASSFGVTNLPQSVCDKFAKYFNRYDHISVREDSGVSLMKSVFSKESVCVLDPTLLLNDKEWESVLRTSKTPGVEPYIFCYLLNYTFDAFPYAEEFALHIRKATGLKLIFGGRPPKNFTTKGIEYRVGIGPEDFISLIYNAKLVITTSFHGTAFAVNFGKPVYSIVDSLTGDDRQASFLRGLGLNSRIVELNSLVPENDFFNSGNENTTKLLEEKRTESIKFLLNSIK